ncbi:MAG: MFS transporter [Candidatus Thermoplasmatota archaeon]|nr:MFS transporter [Candidatus Thermoplasmatota archaeon]MBS3790323.1 MFS transporter [Candidatus Thermoplasmatota archaeon]
MKKGQEEEKFGFKSIISDLKVVLKYRELLILCFAIFVSMIGFGLVMPFLPVYAETYGATDTLIGWMMAVFAVVRLFFSPVGGWLADKIGRKPLMVFGMFLYTVVMFMFGLANTLPELFIYRGAQGAASGLVWPVAMAYIGDVVREEDRGKAMGLYTLTFATGNAVGPMLGGLIAGNFGLSVPFFFTSGLALTSGLLLLFGLKESFEGEMQRRGEKVKRMTRIKNVLTKPMGYLKSITPHPVTFLGISIGSFTVFLGLAVLYPMLPIYGKNLLDLSVTQIGYIFTIIGAVQVVFMFPSGTLADRIGKKKMIVSGSLMASIFIGAIIFAIGYYTLAFIVILYTIGRSLARPSIPALVTSLTPKQNRGKGMGIYTFFQNMAWAAGSFVSGMISDAFGRKYPFIFAFFVGILGTVIIYYFVTEPEVEESG